MVSRYAPINADGIVRILFKVLPKYFTVKKVRSKKHKIQKLKPEQDLSIIIFRCSLKYPLSEIKTDLEPVKSPTSLLVGLMRKVKSLFSARVKPNFSKMKSPTAVK